MICFFSPQHVGGEGALGVLEILTLFLLHSQPTAPFSSLSLLLTNHTDSSIMQTELASLE